MSGTIGRIVPVGIVYSSLAVGGTGQSGSAVDVARQSYDLSEFWLTSSAPGPGHQSRFLQLQSASDSALCLTVSGTEAVGRPLVVRPCRASAAQEFTAVRYVKYRTMSGWFIATKDQRFCVGSDRAKAVVLTGCQGADPDQWFTGLRLGGPVPGFRELWVGDTNLALTASTPKAGGTLTVAADRQLAGQFWTAIPASPGDPGYPYTTALRSFGVAGMCLTTPGAGPAAGTLPDLSRCDGSASQEFFRAASGALGAGNYSLDELVPLRAGSLCVAARGGVHGGSAVDLGECASTLAQSWQDSLEWTSWGLAPEYINAYPVHAGGLPSPGPLLSLSGAQAVLASTVEGSAGQLWLPRSNDTGTVFGSVANASWCLAAPSFAAGTQLVAAVCDGQPDQEFVAVGVTDPQYVEYQSVGDATMCIAAGTAGGSGTPAVLKACSPSDTAEQWWTYAAG